MPAALRQVAVRRRLGVAAVCSVSAGQGRCQVEWCASGLTGAGLGVSAHHLPVARSHTPMTEHPSTHRRIRRRPATKLAGPTRSPADRPVDDSPGRIVADLLVPTTVWRIADTGVGGPGLSPRLARRLVAVYSRPGETIIDLTAGDGVAAAALAGGRVHRRARFSAAGGGLLVAYPTRADALVGSGDCPGSEAGEGCGVGRIVEDEPVYPPAPPVRPESPLAGMVVSESFAVASDGVRLVEAAAGLLAPAGCLIVAAVPAGPVPAGALPGLPAGGRSLVAAAAAVGLHRVQRIVAVVGPGGVDRFTYYATGGDLRRLARSPEGAVGTARAGEWSSGWLLVFMAGRAGRA